MGKSNRTAALERKIELLLGEREQNMEEVEAAERLIARIPDWRNRMSEIDRLIIACEEVIRSDQPAWTRDHIKPSRPFVHKIPVRIGNCSKTALDVLRVADEPMRVREIAIAVLAREGITEPDKANIIKVSNTVGNALKKKLKDGYVATDGAWPGSWWAVKAAKVESN